MTVEDLLRDTAVEPPCGPNLEYDDQFMALVSAAAGKPEQQFGDTIIPAEEPDWEGVVEQSTQLLGRSKDLRTTLLLTRGLTHIRGLAGLAQGLELARRLLDNHWEPVHPQLVYDGVVDPIFRSSALATLADSEGLIRDIRAATLFSTPAGPVAVRAAEATLKREATSPDAMTEAQLRQAALASATVEDAPILSLATALEHCNAIASLTMERMGAEGAPDLAPLIDLLKTIYRLLPVPGSEDSASEAARAAVATDAAAATANGELRTRQDAVRILDSVCRFLERNEPSNPAPLFIRRAQRLIGSGFLDIMRDMAPDSLGHI
ncbi:MAG TPA: type VI secretion system protein TssA, partial [Burkholderiales bacterium]|nr:type VI secretion system protein TssA [Burkholderiales bacterium]